MGCGRLERIGTGKLNQAYLVITMSAKAIAIWGSSFSLLAIATLAWFVYIASGMAYGDLFGIRGQEAALSLLPARALRFLALALTAEGSGVGTIVYHVLSDHTRSSRILAAIGVSIVVSVCTFAFLRP